ncbi:MAG: fibronectin type III domain-containing protein [Phycisphaerae bacterium]|nr:fibronectin type III domain-containing protein [Phycisphaerae bacterium]
MRTNPKHVIRTRLHLVLVAAVCLFPAATVLAQAAPDLVVVDQWEASGTVHFTVKNSGTTTAKSGHSATLAVDGTLVDAAFVPNPMLPGDTYSGAFLQYSWQCTADGSHTVLVRTDAYDIVPESNEKNNTRQETWICDVTAPKITDGPEATNVTQTSAWIVWTTNEDSDSLVRYGTSSQIYKFSESSQKMTTAHKIPLDGLKADTRYYYVVESTDAHGNTVQSKERTFRTLAEPLVILSGPTVQDITQTGATVLWTTNHASDSDVRYGVASGMYAADSYNTTETTSHSVRLEGLAPGTLYYFIVRSKTQSDEAVSDEQTFQTQAGQAQPPDLIVDRVWEDDHQLHARIKNTGGGTAPAGHRAGLFTSDRLIDWAVVTVPLNPGETADIAFMKFFFECHDARHTFRVTADIDEEIVEQDETNNSLDWTTECDVTPLRITEGPFARSIMPKTVDIVWKTNKPADSNALYDRYAGVFGFSQSSSQRTTEHLIHIKGLTPGTVYQFKVRSATQDGQSVESKPGYFRTKTEGGTAAKIRDLVFEREATDFPCYRITAVIRDENDVDKVEFFADGTRLQTDYTPPFQAVLTPGLMGISRGEIFRPWNIEAVVSAAGMLDRLSDLFEPAYECDKIMAEFEYPFRNETFYIPGETAPEGTEIPIRVHAYMWDTILHDVSGVELPPGESGVDLEFVDWPLEEVRFYVNMAHVGTVSSQPDHRYEFIWDAGGMRVGSCAIRVDAVANDQCIQTITRDIEIEEGEPEIETTRQVWREGNAFRIRLNIHNRGTVSYLCECVRDNVDGLQPIQDSFDDYLVWTTPSSHGQHNDVILDLFSDGSSVYEIRAHHTVRLEYYAVPVQYFILGAVKYEIGEDPVEVVDSTGSDEWTISCPCVRTEDDILLDDEIDSAIEGSDYLIVTNPDLCDSEFGGADDVLSEMARLAYHRNGILGYLFGVGSDDPSWIRDCVKSWGREMTGSDGVAGHYLSNGYLLLVGETEILPSWTVNSPDMSWTGGTQSVEVGYSDLPYGDVASSDNVPELCVGRLIGDSDGALTQAMESSLNAGFDRSYGVATSGAESDWENFVGNARDVVDTWDDQAAGGEIMTEEAKAHHWSAYVHKAEPVSGYDFPMDAGDGFVTAVLDGYGMSAIRIDPGEDRGYLVTAGNLDLISTPFSGAASFMVPFNSGDALAAGDIDADGEDEIIVGDISFDRLIVVCDPPNTTSHTYLGFDAELESWDVIACGHVLDVLAQDVVVVARPIDGGTVDIYEYVSSPPGLYRTYRLDIPFSSYDGLAIADIDTSNPGDEIVIGNDSDDRIYVYDRRGTLLMEIPCEPYTAYDSLVAGDMDGDGGDELAVLIDDVIDSKRRLHIFQADCASYDAASGWQLVRGRSSLIYSRFLHCDGARTTGGSTRYDGVTCDDLDGDGKEEVCLARESDDRLYALDGHYADGWKQRYLPVLQDIEDRIDLFVLAGHGNPGSCSPFNRVDIGTLSLTAGPLVFALSCLTGNYEGEWWWYDGGAVDAHSDGDGGFAETFFAQGAAAYIGSTEVSSTTANSAAGPGFLSQWDRDETAGKAFRDYRRSRMGGNDRWRFWAMEYNYYGDPKFGALDGGGAVAPAAEPRVSIAAAEPLDSNPQIELPDYQIRTLDGYDHVTLPGGDVLIEPNTPMVPVYHLEYEVPAGVIVQDVQVQQRDGLQTAIGLNLPLAVMTIAAFPEPNGILIEPEPGWCPDRQLDWRVIPGADGTATLAVTLYPFEYNAQTTESRFYKQYTLEIETLDSPVRISALFTDSKIYSPGSLVTVKVWLNAEGEAQDAFADTVIRQYGSDELVAGLLLDNLAGLVGTASYAATWDSTGATPGFYYAETKIVDTAGQVLARETALFSVKSEE